MEEGQRKHIGTTRGQKVRPKISKQSTSRGTRAKGREEAVATNMLGVCPIGNVSSKIERKKQRTPLIGPGEGRRAKPWGMGPTGQPERPNW